MNDAVNHPSHYTQGGIECIEAIESALTPDEFVGFLKGQVLKYTWRSGHKDDIVQDTAKGIWYAQRLIKFVEEQKCPLVCVKISEPEPVYEYYTIQFSEQWEVWAYKNNEKVSYQGCFSSYFEARSSIPLDKYRPM